MTPTSGPVPLPQHVGVGTWCQPLVDLVSCLTTGLWRSNEDLALAEAKRHLAPAHKKILTRLTI